MDCHYNKYIMIDKGGLQPLILLEEAYEIHENEGGGILPVAYIWHIEPHISHFWIFYFFYVLGDICKSGIQSQAWSCTFMHACKCSMHDAWYLLSGHTGKRPKISFWALVAIYEVLYQFWDPIQMDLFNIKNFDIYPILIWGLFEGCREKNCDFGFF